MFLVQNGNPFVLNEINMVKFIVDNRSFVSKSRMWSDEVVVCNCESEMISCAIDTLETVVSIMFVCSVDSFDDVFEVSEKR